MFSIGTTTKGWAELHHLKVDYAEQSVSTNTKAKHSVQEFDLILADEQVGGRGRGQNTWTNPAAGSSLLSSWIFRLDYAPQPILSCLVGLGLYNALKQTWPALSFSLKAPNDIYLGQKKLAGLLIENMNQGSNNVLIIGLGLNVFSAPRIDIATCLADVHKPSLQEWNLFLSHFHQELKTLLASPSSELSEHQCKHILNSLNEHPLLTEPYLQVEKDGSLVTKSKKISWTAL